MLQKLAVPTLCLTLCVLSGCIAVGRTDSGDPVVGISVGSGSPQNLSQGIAKGAQIAKEFLPYPFDLIATAVGGIAGGYAGNLRGRHKGWEEKEQADKLSAPRA